MTCPHCEELRERIAFLEGELGMQVRDTEHALVAAAIKGQRFGGRQQVADFILTLYRAKGRVVGTFQVLEAIPPKDHGGDERNPDIVKVWAHTARLAIGRSCIETCWGRGYRMTPLGLEKVAAILGRTQP